jgi:hypothetical protein
MWRTTPAALSALALCPTCLAAAYALGAGAGFTAGAAGAVGVRTNEPPPPGQDPAGGLVGGGYDSKRAETMAEGAVNQGGHSVI